MKEHDQRGRNLLLRESERVLLHILRREGALSKAELARLSGMSAQGVAVIMDGLLKHDLVMKGPKQRGRVGQPSTPLLLNTTGAYSIGVHVAPDEIAVCLLDFVGELQACRKLADGAGDVVPVVDIIAAITEMRDTLDASDQAKLLGIGICAPTSLMSQCADRSGRYGSYRASDASTLQRVAEETFGLPVYCVNDIYAASIGEVAMGSARDVDDFLYIYAARLIGAGVVLEGKPIGDEDSILSNLHTMALTGPAPDGQSGRRRLGEVASLVPLERELEACGRTLEEVFAGNLDEPEIAQRFDAWSADSVDALAQAISAAAAVIPLQSVVIDSGLPRREFCEMVAKIDARVSEDMPEGVAKVEVVPGRHGNRAKVIGAGLLPIQREFAPEVMPTYGVPGRRAA